MEEEEEDGMENTLLLAAQPIRRGMRECGRGLRRGSAGQENFTAPLSHGWSPDDATSQGNMSVNICKLPVCASGGQWLDPHTWNASVPQSQQHIFNLKEKTLTAVGASLKEAA